MNAFLELSKYKKIEDLYDAVLLVNEPIELLDGKQKECCSIREESEDTFWHLGNMFSSIKTG